VRLGPDGYIYVADFYNRIIGHYEVPLTHEGRDRFRGRIWRIGSDQPHVKQKMNLSDLKNCLAALESPNPSVVRLALQRVEELASNSQVQSIDLKAKPTDSPSAVVAKAWAQRWIGGKDRTQNWLALSASSDDQVAANAFQILALEVSKQGSDSLRKEVARSAHKSIASWRQRPHATLEAAKILATIGDVQDAKQILDLVVLTKQDDPILHAALRISLRELLKHDEVRNELVQDWRSTGDCGGHEPSAPSAADNDSAVAMNSPQGNELFQILIALPAEMFPTEAGLAYLGQSRDKSELPQDVLTAIATAFPAKDSAKLICFLDTIYGERPAEHLRQLTMVAKLLRDQSKLTKEAKEALAQFVTNWKSLASEPKDKEILVSWFGYDGNGQNKNIPWGIEERTRLLPDGTQDKIPVFSSFTLSEPYMGKFLSAPMAAHGTLSFYICGHNGQPDQPDSQKNRVQLIDASTQEVLLEAFPPRNDVAQLVKWDLKPLEGRNVSVRIIDTDDGGAFAWLAIGGFEPNGLSPNGRRRQLNEVLELLEMINGLPEENTNQKDFLIPSADEYFQLRWKLAANRPVSLDSALQAWLFEQHKFQLASEIVNAKGESAATPLLQRIAAQCDADAQRGLVELLASQSSWHESLLTSVKQGWLSPQALAALPKTWWQANADKPHIAELEGLRPSDSEAAKQRMEKFVVLRDKIQQASGNSTSGKVIFAQNCAICHQFAGQGKVVGPQLEGVGGRGLPRLCEDVMLPNQNVDHAFHAIAILTNDGEVITGLVRQRTDDRIIVVDAKGEERTVSVSDIDSEKSSGNSLMPENFGEILTVQQLADLIQYLRKPTEAQ
jgi:putative heme-binding domain-containing protein